jgi:hypothetical protein
LWSAKLKKIPKRGLFEMTKRIVIPVEDERGLEARVAEHFGRAPFFAVVDLDENGKILNTKTEANKGEHHGGSARAIEKIMQRVCCCANTFVDFEAFSRRLSSVQ